MERCEYKFPLTPAQYEALQPRIAAGIPPDSYGGGKPYTVSSLYFDDARHKLWHQTYDRAPWRYKLRLRVYGTETTDSTLSFFEIKSKLDGRSVKRRRAAPLAENERIWREGFAPDDAARDILRLIDRDALAPASIVSYERLAYAGEGAERLRVTFDSALRIRTEALDLRLGTYGTDVMTDCYCVMEVKSGTNLPLWIVRLLSEQGLGNRSYSKYGHTPYGIAASAAAFSEQKAKELII